jgi:hypothetical protein
MPAQPLFPKDRHRTLELSPFCKLVAEGLSVEFHITSNQIMIHFEQVGPSGHFAMD